MEFDAEKLSHADLVQLVLEFRAEVVQLREENQRLKNRIRELEGKNPTQRLDESYSVEAEQKRRQQSSDGSTKKKRRKQHSPRRGRHSSDHKAEQAEQRRIVTPEGFDVGCCHFVRDRVVWRIIDGRAVRIVYEIWHGPNGEKAVIPGVFARSEFGIEIHVTVAWLVSSVGLSMDKTCELLKFFWQLPLEKSQTDALLNQLSARWESEFETLCDLLAVSAVVHADETGWSINSVWAFLSEQARVMIFGCRKDAETLSHILSKDSFAGVLISDDAAVYRDFSCAQKCWAHLLRKAIRISLLHSECDEYSQFLDQLFDVFYAAKRSAKDGRLSAAGRVRRVNDLDNQLADALVRYCHDEPVVLLETLDDDFANLVRELSRLLAADELFTFVKEPLATATNNEAERTLRSPAQDRSTGRTSKTARGARRRSILTSVFESLRLHLASLNLSSIVDEVITWQRTGITMFDQLRTAAGLPPPNPSRLPALVPDQPGVSRSQSCPLR